MRRTLVVLAVLLALVGLCALGTPAEVKPDQAAKYVGAAACMCHADPIQKSWRETKHAKAFELLKMVGQEKNGKCLPCHTTGYGKGGYGTTDASVNLEGVQCEECHGPAGAHLADPMNTKPVKTPSALVCARCHQDLNIHAKP